MSESSRGPRDSVVLVAAGGVLVAVMLGFSQMYAWYGDEENHLLASQLVNAGRMPYRDFFYNQTPLYIYVNALWMRLRR